MVKVLHFPLPVDLARPTPPDEMHVGYDGIHVAPAPELIEWANKVFISPNGPLANEEHQHLTEATLGFVWCAVEYKRHGRHVAGLTEMPQGTRAGAWAAARADDQLTRWFGAVPDFLITIDVDFARTATDAQFCALIEHELLHAGHRLDEFGGPKFDSEGRPVFGIRGHDVEEFTSIVRRYGIVSDDVRQMVEAAQGRPELGDLDIRTACGTCQRRAA